MIRVSVPATSANLGPGLDAFGLALDLWNRFELAPAAGASAVTVEGVDADRVPVRPDANPVLLAAEAVFRYKGRPAPALTVHITSRIPIGRGLGSSATAVLAGALAADHLTGGGLGPDEILNLTAGIEGHADNLSAALLGGMALVYHGTAGYHAVALPHPDGLVAVVAIPEQPLATKAARARLPEAVPLADATFNVARASLLVAGLMLNRLEWLREGCRDRLHQPYRAALVPGFEAAVGAALDAGAVAASLSGSGSSVLALARRAEAESVRAAVETAWRRLEIPARVVVLDISGAGARVEGCDKP
ncbi:MAG: homoserine kinase [Actinomycetia bacterium]|nr:homoserine kinase [Actinomycetes bacterium]